MQELKEFWAKAEKIYRKYYKHGIYSIKWLRWDQQGQSYKKIWMSFIHLLKEKQFIIYLKKQDPPTYFIKGGTSEPNDSEMLKIKGWAKLGEGKQWHSMGWDSDIPAPNAWPSYNHKETTQKLKSRKIFTKSLACTIQH